MCIKGSWAILYFKVYIIGLKSCGVFCSHAFKALELEKKCIAQHAGTIPVCIRHCTRSPTWPCVIKGVTWLQVMNNKQSTLSKELIECVKSPQPRLLWRLVCIHGYCRQSAAGPPPFLCSVVTVIAIASLSRVSFRMSCILYCVS